MQSTCDLVTSLQHAEFFSFIKAIILVIAGLFIARFINNAFSKILTRYVSSQQSMLLQKITYFSILILFIIAALQQLGFKLSVLLGSAGIATAAIAIASQTSISNIISGLFLIMEKSIQVGDRIKLGNTVGTVTSIDLLSVKIVTANNTFIRIPNESMIKNEIANITRLESRRLDLNLRVHAEEDITKVKSLLLELATSCKLGLPSPVPFVVIQDIDGYEVNLQLSVWTQQANFDKLKDTLLQNILTAFREHNINF